MIVGVFDNEDFQKILDGYDEGPPSGFVDSESTIKKFEEFIDAIATLNPEDEKSRILFMMRVTNMIDMNDVMTAVEVLSAATFHVINLMTIGLSQDEDFMQKYVDTLYQTVLPALKSDGGSIPYWD